MLIYITFLSSVLWVPVLSCVECTGPWTPQSSLGKYCLPWILLYEDLLWAVLAAHHCGLSFRLGLFRFWDSCTTEGAGRTLVVFRGWTMQDGLKWGLVLMSGSWMRAWDKGCILVIPATSPVSSIVLVQVPQGTNYFYLLFPILDTLFTCHFMCDFVAPDHLHCCGVCVSPFHCTACCVVFSNIDLCMCYEVHIHS